MKIKSTVWQVLAAGCLHQTLLLPKRTVADEAVVRRNLTQHRRQHPAGAIEVVDGGVTQLCDNVTEQHVNPPGRSLDQWSGRICRRG